MYKEIIELNGSKNFVIHAGEQFEVVRPDYAKRKGEEYGFSVENAFSFVEEANTIAANLLDGLIAEYKDRKLPQTRDEFEKQENLPRSVAFRLFKTLTR